MVLSGKLWFGRLHRTVGLTLAVALLGAAFGAAPARANTTDGLIVNLSVNYSGFTTDFYPESGWRVKDGPDGVAVAFPQEWGYTYGGDGRLAPYPHSGWRIDERSDDRRITFPDEWFTWGQIIPSPASGDLSLMFPSASSQALLMAAEASLTPEEFSNYLIVQYIQQVIVGRD
ncbi:hypothetical protein [Salinispora arenicola]|uniref:hypothetical protein n=1 Tax=Salinispora arenicola TaxID=168697 RepID=UPI00051634CB|nr:hypothetical protein [Salinispora arenicola]MCN0150688.1 hypothetical protein [Salinispora arenicola]